MNYNSEIDTCSMYLGSSPDDAGLVLACVDVMITRRKKQVKLFWHISPALLEFPRLGLCAVFENKHFYWLCWFHSVDRQQMCSKASMVSQPFYLFNTHSTHNVFVLNSFFTVCTCKCLHSYRSFVFVLNELMKFPFIPKATFSKSEDGFLPRYFTQMLAKQMLTFTKMFMVIPLSQNFLATVLQQSFSFPASYCIKS